ncbi:MAG: ankyrin repeat domain-containing protein, partial [Alphaproteobacteria bacterium]
MPLAIEGAERVSQSRSLLSQINNNVHVDISEVITFIQYDHASDLTLNTMVAIVHTLSDFEKQQVLGEWIKLFVSEKGDIDPNVISLFGKGLYWEYGYDVLEYLLKQANLGNLDNIKVCENLIKSNAQFTIQDKEDELGAIIKKNESTQKIKLIDLFLKDYKNMMYLIAEHADLNPNSLKPIDKNTDDVRLHSRLEDLAALDHDARLLKVLQNHKLIQDVKDLTEPKNYFISALLNKNKTDEETKLFIEWMIEDQLDYKLQFLDVSLIFGMLESGKIQSINVLLNKISDEQKSALFPKGLNAKGKQEIGLSISNIFSELVKQDSTKQHIVVVLNLFHFLPDEYLSDFNVLIALREMPYFIEVFSALTDNAELYRRFITHNHSIAAFKKFAEKNDKNIKEALCLALNLGMKPEEFRLLLEYSIEHNSYNAIKTLIRYLKANPNLSECPKICDPKGRDVITALLVSSVPNKNKLIKECCTNADGSLNHNVLKPLQDFKTNILMLAFLTKNEDVIEKLCSDIEFVKSNFINAIDYEGYTICHYMVLSGLPVSEIGKKLIAFNFKAQEIDTPNKQGVTPLMLALLSDNIEMFRLLLDMGADINAQDNNGFNVLFYACYHAKESFIDEILLSRSIDLNAQNKYDLNALALLDNKEGIPITNDLNNTIASINLHLSSISRGLYNIPTRKNTLNHQDYANIKKILVSYGAICSRSYPNVNILTDIINVIPKLVFKGFYMIYQNIHVPTYLGSFVISFFQPQSWMGILYHTMNWSWLFNRLLPKGWQAIKDSLDNIDNFSARFDFNDSDNLVGLYAIGSFGCMISGNSLKDYMNKMSSDKVKHRLVKGDLGSLIVSDVAGLKSDVRFKTFMNYVQLISRYCQVHSDSKRMPFLARIQSVFLKAEISEACAHICNNYDGANDKFDEKFKNFQELMLGYNARVIHRELRDNDQFNVFIEYVRSHKILVSPELYLACLEYHQFKLQNNGKAWFGARVKDYFALPNTQAAIKELTDNATTFERSQVFVEGRQSFVSWYKSKEITKDQYFDSAKDDVNTDQPQQPLERNIGLSQKTKPIAVGFTSSVLGVGLYYGVYV